MSPAWAYSEADLGTGRRSAEVLDHGLAASGASALGNLNHRPLRPAVLAADMRTVDRRRPGRSTLCLHVDFSIRSCAAP
jgi:hypothetical protein